MFVIVEFLKRIPGWLYAAGATIIGFIILVLRIRSLKQDNTELTQQVLQTTAQAEQAEKQKEIITAMFDASIEKEGAITQAAVQANIAKADVEQAASAEKDKIIIAAEQIPPVGSSADAVADAFNKGHK